MFAHGLRQTQKRAHIYEQALGVPLVSFDFPDVFNQLDTDFAQERDLKKLEECYNKTLDSLNPEDGIILIGVSRGAAAVINFASTHPKKLKGVIVEAPFDCLQTVKTALLKKFGNFSEPLTDSLLSCLFPHYKGDGIKPIVAAETIDTSIPILIICAENDAITPKECSIRLYETLRKNRSPEEQLKIHLAFFSYGTHACLIEEHTKEYQRLFHRFLRTYQMTSKYALKAII